MLTMQVFHTQLFSGLNWVEPLWAGLVRLTKAEPAQMDPLQTSREWSEWGAV